MQYTHYIDVRDLLLKPLFRPLAVQKILYSGHSISVNEDHPAQGLAVDPLYFRISILPRWQIPDQHESRTRPLRFTQNLTHVFL